MEQKIDTQSIAERLRALSRDAPARNTKNAVLRTLKKEIAAARTAGRTWREIAACLAEGGLTVGMTALRVQAGGIKRTRKAAEKTPAKNTVAVTKAVAQAKVTGNIAGFEMSPDSGDEL